MPNFHIVPLDETTRRTGPRRRSRITREYLGYIDQLEMTACPELEPVAGAPTQASVRVPGTSAEEP